MAKYLQDCNFDIGYTSTLNRLWRFLDNAFYEHDALHCETSGPLGHLFADLSGSHGQQSLYGIGSFSQVEENHLVSLGTGSVDSRTKDHRLAIQRGSEVRNPSSGAIRPGLRLIQREFPVELDGIVLSGS